MLPDDEELVVNPHALVAQASTREEQEDAAVLLDELLNDETLPAELEQEIRAALSDLARMLA